jgi:hypothetical protein
MKNENIFSIIINNLYINELSKLKFDTKNLTLLKNITKTLLHHKWESFYIPNSEQLPKSSNEITFKYLFKHKPNKTKHLFNHCFSSMEYLDKNTLVLGAYFRFKIFLYDLKENILEQIIGDDDGDYSDYGEDDDEYYVYSNDKYNLQNKKVKERDGTVDKITIIDDRMLSAYDGSLHYYHICDYINGTIVESISMNVPVLKNLDAYYNHGQIFYFNDAEVNLRVRPKKDIKLNNFDIYSFGNFLAFKNEKRIYIYQMDKERNVSGYKKVYKFDEPNGISTDLITYKDNHYLFGNSKGELKQLSFTDKLYKNKIKLQEGKLTTLYRYNSKLIISSNNFGVVKISDYYTLYTKASINTYLPISKILCLPNNKLIVLSIEKGEIEKNDQYDHWYEEECESEKSEVTTKNEYYDATRLFTFDLREKDSFTTGFRHNEIIQSFIELKKDNYISASAGNIYLWQKDKLVKTLNNVGEEIQLLKRLNDTIYLVFGRYRIYIYKGKKCFKEIRSWYDRIEPVLILDEFSFIYRDSQSLYYLNIQSPEIITYVDKYVNFCDMIYEQGKVIYLKDKTLFCFNTRTLRSNQLKKGGSILSFRKKDCNTICFNTKDKLYELDIETMEINQVNNTNKNK